jgi:hypothetical protein
LIFPRAPTLAALSGGEQARAVRLQHEETTAGAYDRLIEFEEFGKLVGLDERYADEARYS